MSVMSCSGTNTNSNFSGHVIITTIIIKKKNLVIMHGYNISISAGHWEVLKFCATKKNLGIFVIYELFCTSLNGLDSLYNLYNS